MTCRDRVGRRGRHRGDRGYDGGHLAEEHELDDPGGRRGGARRRSRAGTRRSSPDRCSMKLTAGSIGTWLVHTPPPSHAAKSSSRSSAVTASASVVNPCGSSHTSAARPVGERRLDVELDRARRRVVGVDVVAAGVGDELGDDACPAAGVPGALEQAAGDDCRAVGAPRRPVPQPRRSRRSTRCTGRSPGTRCSSGRRTRRPTRPSPPASSPATRGWAPPVLPPH